VRTLRQLETFVEAISLPARGGRNRPAQPSARIGR
jgi:hypothetical protein